MSHIPMGDPFCKRTRSVLSHAADELGMKVHQSGTVVTIEGPRFSTRAESNLFRSWGCDLVNMTTVPEATLAKELGLCYASIALPTDYDCWKEQEVNILSLTLPLVLPLLVSPVSSYTEHNIIATLEHIVCDSCREVPVGLTLVCIYLPSSFLPSFIPLLLLLCQTRRSTWRW